MITTRVGCLHPHFLHSILFGQTGSGRVREGRSFEGFYPQASTHLFLKNMLYIFSPIRFVFSRENMGAFHGENSQFLGWLGDLLSH